MNRENFKILIDLYGEGKRDLIEYFEFSKQIEFINNMSNEQFNKLRNEVIDYYSFVLEKFGNVDELENITNYVLLCYKIGGLNGVETFVSERFCDENYQMELNESNNNMLYAETFKNIKSIFEKIIISWHNNLEVDNYFKEINDILTFISQEFNNIFICFESKDKLVEFLQNKLVEKRIGIHDKEILNFDCVVNKFILHINEVIDNDFKVSTLKKDFYKLLNDCGNIGNINIYKNLLVSIVEKSMSSNTKEIVVDEDAKRVYLGLKNQLFDYVEHSISNKYGLEYYKRYLNKNINKYFEYDDSNKVCNINFLKIQELFRIINCYNLICYFGYLRNFKINFKKIDMQFVLEFEQILQELNDYDYNKEELEKIYLLYKHSIECSDTSNLDELFVKRKGK